MSTISLAAVHAKYNLIETVRVPIAVIGSLVFPTLAFCLFVLPQRVVVDTPDFAVAAIASMVVFAFMSASLFSIGLDMAEQRSKPWWPYLRTLPGSPVARIVGLMAATLVISVVAMIPLLTVGALFTAAAITPGDLLAAIGLVVLTAVPSALIGIVIGTTSGPKAAIAITQVAMFVLAFGGGLFLPPVMFPAWLDTVSKFLPVRQAREIVVAAALGDAVPLWAVLGIVAWTVVLGALAIWLYRSDEGRRFR
ncbi:ABC-2 type transport system permease protein [Microbacterium terrae]|uniref:ABC-2 family transporter protein n=1 Tax=Microbacterium terrae TaxID=69369 RepID=A0A0M2H444_9MICO|nr:ABC transporter permease [Microbacterium terrae]KJL39151.1 ABC-2 family transporter protein [Microbacterium terrae]MBP1077694.1 ABC-2 type transport system permease protein [Microbacterium terrae]GLJ99861.1 ABC transporter [Microbacterium terrae]